jgi:hypothetical protein
MRFHDFYATIGALHFIGKSYLDAKHALLDYRQGPTCPNNRVFWSNTSEYEAMQRAIRDEAPWNLLTSFAWPVGLPFNALPCVVRQFHRGKSQDNL